MATLIQSKQIEGIVTASVVEGSLTVSGSIIATGSQSILGSITASSISSSGPIYGVRYDDIDGTPNFIGGTGIVITQVGDNITITNTGGGGGVSGSAELISSVTQLESYTGSNDIIILGLNDFTSSIQGQVDSLIAATSSYETTGRGIISGSEQLHTDLDSRYALSGSSGGGTTDISSLNTFTSSYYTDSASFDSRIDALTTSTVPGGTISGSQQITDLGFISSSHTDITQLNQFTSSFSQSVSQDIDGLNTTLTNRIDTVETTLVNRIDNIGTFTSSIDSRVTALEGATDLTGSDSQTLSISGDQLTISSGNTITIPTGSGGAASIPDGTISGSQQITDLGFTSGSHTELPSGLLSSSVDFATYSSSVQTTIDNIVHTSIPGGTISGSEQLTSLGFISESISTDITSLNTFTASIDTTIKTKLDADGVLSGSITNYLPSGIISGSVLRTLDGTGVFSGSLVAGTNITINQDGDNFIISSSASGGGGSSNVTVSDSAPSSPSEGDLWWKSDDGNLYVYYDGYWVISIDTTNALPLGVISGSSQITALGFVSSSGDSTPAGTISGSAQITALGFVSSSGDSTPEGTISGSAQITSLGFISESFSTDGTGILSGSKTDISSLNTFTSSIQTEVDGLSAATSSYITSLPSGLLSGSKTEIPSGTISGSSQLTSSYDTRYALSGSGGSANTTYDGNRVISNEDLGDLFTNSVNPGTSGSIQEFLNAVFYPNTGPTITTGNQTIIEYVTSGTTITTLSGTDPEGQAITFGTASAYTDDLVRVTSNGVMTLNALAESSSFNTDLVGGVHGHKVEVTATDTFGTTTEKDIYVIVTPNSTPVFRETSTSGNVITSVTANLNESSTNNTLVKRVYFSDANGDNITIYSSSIDNNHFDVTKYSTYVDIRQNTGSLDYEQQTSYTFSISASDEHYEAGQDSDSIVGLPITVNVTDNLTPTVNNQTLSSINENSSNGATVGSISAADNEGNTITFVNFELHQLQLDNSIVSSGSYSGTSQLTDPHENPFQMSTSGIVTRKTGVYLNSDLINEYIYRVQVTDPYNGTSDVALITINITDDTPAILTDNWSAGPYIKESELSGATMKTTDYGSAAADYDSNQSGTWSSSNSAISINSNGNLLLGVNLSGSVTQSGDTIDSTITFTNTFGTTTTDSLTVNVVGNEAPTATFTNQSSIFNSNQATSGTNLVSVSISDTESDSPYQLTIGGTHAAKLNAVPQNVASSSWELQASEDLIGGTYTYDVTITDSYSETTTYSSRTLTIVQGDTGTLGGDTTSYIIESAESGEVLRDATGYNQGNASQLSVSYTNYGSPSVQSYTSSNEAFNIDTSGNITLGLDLSGSVTQSGDTINSDITFTDQYGNIGSGSLSVNVFANNPATATFSENSSFFNTNQATGSVSLVDITGISDTESNTPYVVTLSGTNASSFNVVSQNANGTSWELQPSSDLSAGTYSYNVVITDSYSEVTTYSRSLTILQADNGTLGGDTTSYIIESGENGDAFRDASGFGAGNASQLSVSYNPSYGSPVLQSFTSSNSSVAIDGSGYITFNGDLSGTGSGDTITSDITFDDQYGNVGSGSVTINVFANNAPTATFSANSSVYNENQATSGTNLVDVSITDTEGDTPYSMSLSGNGAWAISAVPQNSDSSSYEIQVTYDTSSLVAGTFDYDVEVTDSFGKTTNYNGRSFTIAAADDGTLVATDAYIIESATSGDLIRRNANGRTGTQSSVAVSYSPSYGSPVATNFASSNALIDIDSSGRLSVGNDISGSGSTNGSIIATTITWNDQYNNNGSQVISIDVAKNFAPTVNTTSTFNLNTNQATGSSSILRLNLTDTEGDTINASGLTWTGYDSTYFQPSNTTGQMNLLVNNTSVPAGEYDYTASMEDVHGFSTNVVSGSYTIAQADNGTLGGDTAIYSIESAESGEAYRDATGYNNGNTAQVSVSYSPSYGSPSVQSFSSSNPAIAIDNSGNLTLGVDISGSVTQSGDTINSTITFTDQYGNSDTGTVTATIFGNQSPAAGFTATSNYDSDASVSGSTAGILIVSDTENNSPFTFTLAGTDGDKFNVAGSSSPFTIQPTGSLDAGTYSINITVTDNYSESVTLTNEAIVVDAAEVLSNIYVYTLPIDGTYANVNGISANGSGTPPSPTIATTYGFFTAFVDSDTLGDSTITVSYGTNYTATKRATVSGSNVDTALDSVGMSIGSSERVYIFIPSGSDTLGGVPTSLTTSDPGSSTTTGEYVLFVANEDSYQGSSGGLSNDIKTANIHKLTLDTAVDGYTDWFVVGTNDRYNAGNSTLYLRLAPSSGSVPS